MAFVQRLADVVDHLALRIIETRRAAMPDIFDDLGIHAAFESEPLVGVPFVVRGPMPCGDQDRNLGQLRRKGCIEPQECAQACGVPRHLRAVEPGHHRWGWGATLAGDRFVVGLFLVLVHFARRKQLQPHLGFLLFFNRCDVGDAGSRSTIISCNMKARARDILNSATRWLRSIAGRQVRPAMETPPCPIWKNFAAKPAPGWRPIVRRRCGGRWRQTKKPFGAARTPNSPPSRSASGSSGCATRAGPCPTGPNNMAAAVWMPASTRCCARRWLRWGLVRRCRASASGCSDRRY